METAAAIMERPIPTKIGRYKVLCELGHGAMAMLYLARADGPGSFERLFAIKMIHDHLGREQQFINMFLNEARLCARIHHPNVISVYDVDVDAGRYYLAMDYMSGENLAVTLKHTWNRAKPFPIDIATYIVAHCAEGLHAAHELKDSQGARLDVVHRDVAPQNIMLGYDGTVRVMDFGIAKAADSVSSTRPGSMKGTVAYMAPEQIRTEALDRRADVFALGVVLWETTVGKRLFKSSNDINTAARVLRMTVPKPSSIRKNYPESLEKVVMRALCRDPAQRYQTARELGEALTDFLSKERMRVAPADLERFMKDVFGPMYEERAEMERKASAPVVPERVTSLPQRDESMSLGGLGISGDVDPVEELPSFVVPTAAAPKNGKTAEPAQSQSPSPTPAPALDDPTKRIEIVEEKTMEAAPPIGDEATQREQAAVPPVFASSADIQAALERKFFGMEDNSEAPPTVPEEQPLGSVLPEEKEVGQRAPTEVIREGRRPVGATPAPDALMLHAALQSGRSVAGRSSGITVTGVKSPLAQAEMSDEFTARAVQAVFNDQTSEVEIESVGTSRTQTIAIMVGLVAGAGLLMTLMFGSSKTTTDGAPKPVEVVAKPPVEVVANPPVEVVEKPPVEVAKPAVEVAAKPELEVAKPAVEEGLSKPVEAAPKRVETAPKPVDAKSLFTKNPAEPPKLPKLVADPKAKPRIPKVILKPAKQAAAPTVKARPKADKKPKSDLFNGDDL